MAYTQFYFIQLWHYVNTLNSCINLLFPHNSSHSFQQFHTKTHGHLWSISHKLGLFLQSQNRESGLSVGSPLIQHRFNFGGTKFHSHFRPHTHQNTIYCINHDPRYPNSPYTITDCPNEFHKFSHFGPKFWDRSNGHSRPQSTQAFTKHLNKG